MEKTTLTCPKCQFAQEAEIPENKCLVGYKCEKCAEIIMASSEGGHCCVICEYSDKKCPQRR